MLDYSSSITGVFAVAAETVVGVADGSSSAAGECWVQEEELVAEKLAAGEQEGDAEAVCTASKTERWLSDN